MAVSKERKAELVKEFGKDVKNTGSTEVQIAILTDEINNLTEHLKENKHEDMTIEVDGNISPIKAQELKKYGASIYVAGTTALFKGNVENFSDNIRKLRSVI